MIGVRILMYPAVLAVKFVFEKNENKQKEEFDNLCKKH